MQFVDLVPWPVSVTFDVPPQEILTRDSVVNETGVHRALALTRYDLDRFC